MKGKFPAALDGPTSGETMRIASPLPIHTQKEGITMKIFRVWRPLLCGLALATSSAVFAQTAHEGFEREVRSVLSPLTGQAIATYTVVHLDAEHAPWTDSGLTLAAGDRVTVLLQGRAWLSRHYDISLEAPLQVWRRIGDDGRITRSIDATDTFTADRAGPLQIKNLPLRWLDPQGGAQESGVRGNPDGGGGVSIALIRWSPQANIGAALATLARQPNAPAWAAPALARLQTPPSAPDGWTYLWELGPAEIFRETRATGDDGGPTRRMHAHTRNDVAILQTAADAPLSPDTELRWSWKVDRLPGRSAENTVITHDYLSIAVEFDNGQDLTYLWSSALPVGEVFRCPLPGWKDRETHVVARSGAADLGKWLNESRNVWRDYAQAIGGEPPKRIVRVWLIANSVFGRGEGQAQFGNIRLGAGGRDSFAW